jgi:hypothetical protein
MERDGKISNQPGYSFHSLSLDSIHWSFTQIYLQFPCVP